MSDQVYKNLGKFMSYEDKEISAGKPKKVMIKYTQPNYQDPKKVWEVGVFEDKISDELLEKIVSLSSGEEICVHTIKNDRGYADLHDITDAKDAPQKSAGGKTKGKGGSYPPRDETGVAVGAAWTNAIELLKAGLDLDEVAELAEKILALKQDQEAKARAAKKAKEEVKEKTEAQPSKLEQMKAKKEAEAAAKKKTTTTKKKPAPEPEDFGVDDDDIPEMADDEDLDDIPVDEE